uniref:Variant surface glycoprotein 1109 n=1 Tax=Trypanosoma brucei TaxID=5691 RepID=M4SVJ0_9TRYP|nr:variant surface glycoprotein 1109 [Trypanosoma brucei]
MQKSVAACILLVFVALASADDDYERAATTACHELTFLSEAVAKLKEDEKRARDQVSNIAGNIALIEAGRCVASSEAEKIRLQALYALETRQLKAAVDQLQQLTIIGRAKKTLQARTAQLLLLLHRGTKAAQPAMSAGTPVTTVLASNSNSPKTCAFKAKTAPADHEVCPADSDADPKIKAGARNPQRLKKLKVVSDEAFDSIEITGTAVHIGALAAAETTNVKGWCDANSATAGRTSNNALGVIHVTTTPIDTDLKPHNIGASGTVNEPCQDSTAEEYITKSRKVTAKALATAICTMRTTTIQTVGSYLEADIKNLLNDAETQKIAEEILYGNIKKDGDADHKKAAVKKLFGIEEGSIREQIITPLTEKHINYKVNDENSKQTVTEATSNADGHIALAACYGQLHRETLKKQASAKTTVSVEKCKPDADENKCKEDSDCDYGDGKCKLKKGVKEEEKKRMSANHGIANGKAKLAKFPRQ